MTAIKERFVKMLPEIPGILPAIPDDKVQQMIDIIVTVETTGKQEDIEKSGLYFGENITDENHDERMQKFFATAGKIKVDEQAIRDLREGSMI